MSATTPIPPSNRSHQERTPEEQAIAAALAPALAEATSVTVRAIRLLGRLIDAEDANLTALDALEADAKRAMVDPPSLEAARQAGQDLDDVKAERAAIVPRVIDLANASDRTTRGLRHTTALQARILAGRPFRPLPPLAPTPGDDPGRPPPPPRAPRDGDVEPVERPDLYDAPERFDTERFDTERFDTGRSGNGRSEAGDELGARTLEEAVRATSRSLSEAAARLVPGPDAPHLGGPSPSHTKASPSAWEYEPGKTRPFPLLSNLATRPREPDT